MATFLLVVVLLAALWIAAAGATTWLAVRRGGTPLKWSALGLLLGPLGAYVAWRLVRPCPQCGVPVLREVATCPACAAQIPRLDPADNPRGPLWSYRRDW